MFESLECVFEDVYDDRWSEKSDAGVREVFVKDAFGVFGVCGPFGLVGEGNVCVSTIKEACSCRFTFDFLESEDPKRRTDLQLCAPETCGEEGCDLKPPLSLDCDAEKEFWW